MNKIENVACCFASRLGSLCGRYAYLPSKMKSIILHYLIIQILVIIATIAYVEIGHDKGWKRADVWYTCLHTHHHFSWQ